MTSCDMWAYRVIIYKVITLFLGGKNLYGNGIIQGRHRQCTLGLMYVTYLVIHVAVTPVASSQTGNARHPESDQAGIDQMV